jgi:hypothetical protein
MPARPDKRAVFPQRRFSRDFRPVGLIITQAFKKRKKHDGRTLFIFNADKRARRKAAGQQPFNLAFPV